MRLACMLALIVALAVPAWGDVSRYRFKSGDQLEVLVWQEEGLQRQVLVAPDGTISFPLVGHIFVRGRTASEVEYTLTGKLREYITDPVVTVSYQGSKEINEYDADIYVTGQVRQPGLHRVDRPTNVLQAISHAGGLTEFAAKRRIKVIRKIKKREVAIAFDYADVTTGRDMSTNIRLKSGDVVVVPERGLFGGLFE